MKQLPFFLILFCTLILACLSSSCSLERRHYRSGYYSETNFGKGNTLQRESSENIHDFEIIRSKQTATLVGNTTANINNPETSNSNQINQEQHDNVQMTPSVAQVSLATSSESTPSDTLKRSTLLNNLPSAEEYGLAEDAPRVTGFAIAALVLGILCLLTGFVGSIICAILAVIFGLIALNKIRKQPEKWKGKGMAWAGYICAVVGLTIWTIYFMLF